MINDNIGNRTRDLPAWSAVPQPTAPPRAPVNTLVLLNIIPLSCTNPQRWNNTQIFYGNKHVSDKSCTENQNTHFMFNNFFPKTAPFMR
jgi:hypothetical protein